MKEEERMNKASLASAEKVVEDEDEPFSVQGRESSAGLSCK